MGTQKGKNDCKNRYYKQLIKRTKRNISKTLCGLAMHSQYKWWIIRIRLSETDSVSKRSFSLKQRTWDMYDLHRNRTKWIIFAQEHLPHLFVQYVQLSTNLKWKIFLLVTFSSIQKRTNIRKKIFRQPILLTYVSKWDEWTSNYKQLYLHPNNSTN